MFFFGLIIKSNLYMNSILVHHRKIISDILQLLYQMGLLSSPEGGAPTIIFSSRQSLADIIHVIFNNN